MLILAGGLPIETGLLAIIGCIYILLLKCSLMYIVPLQQIKAKERKKDTLHDIILCSRYFSPKTSGVKLKKYTFPAL